MAEGGPGRGRGGRGAIIARLLEMERRPGQPPTPAGDGPPPTPPQTVQEQPVQVPQPVQLPQPVQVPQPRPGGRGAMLQRLQQAVQEPVQPTPVPSTSAEPTPAAQPVQPTGRGRLMQRALGSQSQAGAVKPEQATLPALQPQLEQATLPALQPQLEQATHPALQPQPSAPVETDVRSVARRMRRLEIEPSTQPVIMRGTGGRLINATANYIPLELQEGRGIYEYEVRFSPTVDDRSLCERLLFGQHRDILRFRTFDGVVLYLPEKLEEEVMKLTSTHPITNETHIITLTFKRERSMGECTHMFNVLFNNIQRELNLKKLGREYFCQDLAHKIPQHRLEVWPGYVTAVDFFEGGIMLNCNASSRVLRTQTVLELINDIISTSGGRDWKETLQKLLIGQSVMTRRPVNLYRVDDIDFERNPLSEYEKPDGTRLSYVEYHKRKDIHIRDMNQPLLVHRPKPSKRPGGSGLLMLVPELCFLTGLTDEMRADFKVMKDVGAYTRINPNQRIRALQTFIDNIKGSANCVKLLSEWGLKVPDRTVKLDARVLNPERIYFGNGVDEGSERADWTRAAISKHMLEVVPIENWLVVHVQRDERNARDFVEMMIKVCPQIGVQINYPGLEKLRDDRTDTYLRTLREHLNSRLQLVVVIFPSSRDDRYAAIKKLCCIDRPIPSQVINSRTISKPDKLRSIVQKIALQINCKLGGALWAVNIPFKNALVCGIDTYHDTKKRGQSIAAFVASMNKDMTRWHSQIFMQSSDREMVDGLRSALLTAIYKYHEVNKKYPDTVVVYRDGVGDGQLRVCKEHEVQSLERAFVSIAPDYNPAFLFIVCQKRINTRIFLTSGRDYDNPPPGSVVDHTVTRRTLHDFFLVSQLVRQGTVTPTHYIVLHNTTKLDPDKIQKFTYKMTHLYYNWPGTIRVPAPCQYAHKLAHLVGCSIHMEPAKVLCDKLFFL